MAEQFQNFYVTKLREACDAVATTIYVDTVPTITEGTLVIEYANSTKHEIIHFTGVSGYGLTGCTRGMEGTTAQSHSAGVDVRQNLTAGIIDKIINGVITTENIADSAVTSDKVDFTTLKTDGTTSLPSINIADGGKYLVTAGLNFYNSTASQYGQLNVQVEVDETLVAGTDYIIQIAPHSSLNTYTSTSWCVIVDVPANKTVRLRATTQDRVTFRRTWMNAVKIG